MKSFKNSFYLITTAIFLALIINPSAFAADKLPGYGADLTQTSVSGLSSGAFMTSQLHVAFSSQLAGAGIVAGGPYYCSGCYSSNPFWKNAVYVCMDPLGDGPDAEILFGKAQKFAKEGLIDDLNNLKDDKVYIFSGSSDHTVATKVVDQTKKFYELAGVPASNIKYVRNIDSGHAFITDNEGDVPCSKTDLPYINDCDFFQAYDILRHIYGAMNAPAESLSGKLVEFDQGEFADTEHVSMSKNGYAYIPKSCESKACKVHISLHGCKQGYEVIGDKYYTRTKYNELADTNDIIVLYPQAKPSDSPPNPEGCWDWWGYASPDPNDPDFHTKKAVQMSAIMNMVKRLGESKK